jgi:HNH endonuclease/NUMOD4 motif
MTNVNEIWVNAYNYEQKYEVSNLGKVRKKSTKRELIGHINYGYHIVSLTKNNKTTNKRVHRLVLQSFLGNKEGLVVNHKNGIKTDNRLENLEWVTISENTQHSFDMGFQVHKKGVDYAHSKIWMHKEYGFFICTKDLYKLHGTNGVNIAPMKKIREKYIQV